MTPHRPDLPVRKPPDARAIALMVLLCIAWGLQQVVMKATAHDVAPVMQLSIRFAIAALFFGSIVLIREGPRAFLDGTAPSGLALGLCFSAEFLLIGQAVAHTTAAHTVVFLYSAPIFTALGLQIVPEERLSGIQWWGIAIAFAGIAVAFLGYSSRPVMNLLFGDLLALLAGVAWGASNVVLRRSRIGGASTAKTVCYQVGLAAVLLYVFAAATDQTHVVLTPRAVAGLTFQTLGIAISSYLVWYWMLRRYLTSRLMLMSLLTPLFGVGFGAGFLGDPIEPRFGAGACLVLAGILIVNARQIFARPI